MTNRDELHLLMGAYALDALTADERADFEKYLEGSEEARAEVASLTDTAVMLGLASEPVQPPAALKARILAQVAATPQLAPIPEADVVDIRSAIDSRATAKAHARWFARPAAILTAAAASLVLIAGGAVLGVVNAPTPSQTGQASALAELSAADDVQHATSGVAGGGNATIIWSLELQRSAVMIDGLPQLSDDRTYELWYIDSTGATPAGMFSAADNGRTIKVLDGKMGLGNTIGITVEPRGGSTSPTTVPILAMTTA